MLESPRETLIYPTGFDLLQTARRGFSKLPSMTHQTSFAQAEFAEKKKITRREKFLARMEEVISWARLLAVLAPHYPKGERGGPRREKTMHQTRCSGAKSSPTPPPHPEPTREPRPPDAHLRHWKITFPSPQTEIRKLGFIQRLLNR